MNFNPFDLVQSEPRFEIMIFKQMCGLSFFAKQGKQQVWWLLEEAG